MTLRGFFLASAITLFLLGATAPAWAAENCQCDTQLKNGGVLLCHGSCPGSSTCQYTGQLPTESTPGYWSCGCNGLTMSYCHTVVVYDLHMTNMNVVCSGDCPPPWNECSIGASDTRCPGYDPGTECRCGY